MEKREALSYWLLPQVWGLEKPGWFWIGQHYAISTESNRVAKIDVLEVFSRRVSGS
jgi:hypothetical protein